MTGPKDIYINSEYATLVLSGLDELADADEIDMDVDRDTTPQRSPSSTISTPKTSRGGLSRLEGKVAAMGPDMRDRNKRKRGPPRPLVASDQDQDHDDEDDIDRKLMEQSSQLLQVCGGMLSQYKRGNDIMEEFGGNLSLKLDKLISLQGPNRTPRPSRSPNKRQAPATPRLFSGNIADEEDDENNSDSPQF